VASSKKINNGVTVSISGHWTLQCFDAISWVTGITEWR